MQSKDAENRLEKTLCFIEKLRKKFGTRLRQSSDRILENEANAGPRGEFDHGKRTANCGQPSQRAQKHGAAIGCSKEAVKQKCVPASAQSPCPERALHSKWKGSPVESWATAWTDFAGRTQTRGRNRTGVLGQRPHFDFRIERRSR